MVDTASELSDVVPASRALRERKGLRYLVFELVLSRALPAAFFLFFLGAQVAAVEGRLASASWPLALADRAFILQRGLSVTFYLLVVILYVVRRPVVGRHSSPLGAVVALAGTFLIIIVPLVLGAPPMSEDAVVLLVSCAVILIGTVFTLISLATLGSCFGILPEVRGLVTRGPYRLVRHPVYLSELISMLGMIIATLSPLMLVTFLATVGLQYWRTINEERVLEEAFPEYREYRRRTWRIIPFVH